MKNKILSLQILRAYAAILVAICHIWNDGWLPKWFVNLGEYGVDVFFVLSGFIMSLTVKLNFDDKIKNSTVFILKRLIRIFPTYLIIAIPLLLFNIKAEGFKDLYFYFGNLTLLPSFTDDPDYKYVLGPGWTLCYEMLFYYLLAFLILFFDVKRKLLISCGIAILTIVFYVQVFNFQGPKLGWVNFSYIMGDPLLLNFSLGIISYFIYERFKNDLRISPYLGLVGIIAISLLAAYLIKSYPDDRFYAFGLPAFILVLIFLFIPLNEHSYLTKKMVLIGDASYSIYLLHYYAAFFKPKVMLINNFLNMNLDLYLNLMDISLLLSSIIIGCIFYLKVEMTIVNKLNFRMKVITK